MRPRASSGRQHNLPARVRQGSDGVDELEPIAFRGSADIVSAAAADAFAMVPADGAIQPGELVDFRPTRRLSGVSALRADTAGGELRRRAAPEAVRALGLPLPRLLGVAAAWLVFFAASPGASLAADGSLLGAIAGAASGAHVVARPLGAGPAAARVRCAGRGTRRPVSGARPSCGG